MRKLAQSEQLVVQTALKLPSRFQISKETNLRFVQNIVCFASIV